MSKSKKIIEISEALLNPDNWKARIADIALQTGKSQSTVSEYVQRRLAKCLIEVKIIENTESEAAMKLLDKQRPN